MQQLHSGATLTFVQVGIIRVALRFQYHNGQVKSLSQIVALITFSSADILEIKLYYGFNGVPTYAPPPPAPTSHDFF